MDDAGAWALVLGVAALVGGAAGYLGRDRLDVAQWVVVALVDVGVAAVLGVCGGAEPLIIFGTAAIVAGVVGALTTNRRE